MIEHHIQKTLITKLAFSDGLKFSELKPEGIENKLFDYHLKAVIRNGYAEKNQAGEYSLTPEGKRLGLRSLSKEMDLANKADSVLFLVVRRKSDGAWMLYKRAIHPLRGRVGFMHALPKIYESTTESARRQCKERTGLDCEFTPLGGGFFKTYSGEDAESFVNFTLMYCDDAKGELEQNNPNAEYVWVSEPNFSADEMIPNMKLLSDLYVAKQPFFVEQSFEL